MPTLSTIACEELARRISPPAEVRRDWLQGLRPHPGPQTAFLAASADIVIYGGGAGGGKTRGLLMEALRHTNTRGFGAVIFRRELTRVTNEGGMWDEAMEIYPSRGGKARQSPRMEFRFDAGGKIQFGHLEHENSKHSWSGAQIALLCFDQLEEFTGGQFWFMLGRNRSTCGVRPYVRATANPVPPEDPVGGWLSKLLAWWWNPETGYPIPERSGVVRWLVRVKEEIRWAASRQEAVAEAMASGIPRRQAERMPKSLTFIPAGVGDNPSIPEDYLANLYALPLVERERLLHGNWKIRPQAGLVFNRAWFEIVEARPALSVAARGWDKAGSKGKGDHSSGGRIDYAGGMFYISDLVRGQWSYGERETVIRQVTEADGTEVESWLEQEPGSGGKESAERSVLNLAGFDVHAQTAQGTKLARAKALAAQAEVGNVKLVRGDWNEGLLNRLHNFTGADGGKDDDVDALSLAFNKLAAKVAGGTGVQIGRVGPSPKKAPLAERQRERAARRAARAVERRSGMMGIGGAR